jgi:hypothetical protein
MEISTATKGASDLVQEMAADCETVAKELSTRLGDMEAYLRLNVDRGMENLIVNEWDDLGPIETHTSAYAETAIISEALDASLMRLKESTGTVTLGQISAYAYTNLELVSKFHLLMILSSSTHRQGSAGQARKAEGRLRNCHQECERQQ